MAGKITALRALRVNRQPPLTLDQLAERTGYSKAQLSQVETGKHAAGNRLVAALAKVHKLTVEQMRTICEGVYRHGRRKTA